MTATAPASPDDVTMMIDSPGLMMSPACPITIMMAAILAFAQRQQPPVPAPIFCLRVSWDLISSFFSVYMCSLYH